MVIVHPLSFTGPATAGLFFAVTVKEVSLLLPVYHSQARMEFVIGNRRAGIFFFKFTLVVREFILSGTFEDKGTLEKEILAYFMKFYGTARRLCVLIGVQSHN